MTQRRVCGFAFALVAAGYGVACGSSATSPDAPPASATASATPPVASTPPAAAAKADAGPDASHTGDADGGLDAPFLAVFSAFPAETAPLLAQATIASTTMINGHTFRIGTLKGVHVAIGLTGMGLPNATATAHALLAQLPVTGVVFSGVAGSKSRIGDVEVPVSWQLRTTTTYAANAAWLQIAAGIVAGGSLCLEKCTVVPATGVPVCLDHVPAVGVGGAGQSTDVTANVACQAGGDDVFGCDVGSAAASANMCQPMGPPGVDAGADPVVTDNETAAVAAEAAARNLPFIAFRGVSDGSGDPLGLPGYPTQFFAYYRLAARNAAATTIAFVERAATAKP